MISQLTEINLIWLAFKVFLDKVFDFMQGYCSIIFIFRFALQNSWVK